jgi:sugar/nucleoside kinase (ribokinase family)
MGSRGAEVSSSGATRQIDAFPAKEVDPTGAGDAFAAGFLAHLIRGGSVNEAARWGACIASFAVEGPGTTGLPTLERARERLDRHPEVRLQ